MQGVLNAALVSTSSLYAEERSSSFFYGQALSRAIHVEPPKAIYISACIACAAGRLKLSCLVHPPPPKLEFRTDFETPPPGAQSDFENSIRFRTDVETPSPKSIRFKFEPSTKFRSDFEPTSKPPQNFEPISNRFR